MPILQQTRKSLTNLMRQHLKTALASGLGWRVSAPYLRNFGLAVLMYHRIVKPGSLFSGTGVVQFREQMAWLKKNCRVIDPSDFDEVLGSTGRSGSKPPVLVTFDDGYRDFYENAYPVLQEFRLPSIVFLATGHIDRGDPIWTDLITYGVRTSPRDKVVLPWHPEQVFSLSDAASRLRLERLCKHFLKSVPDAERRSWQDLLIRALGLPDDLGLERQMLNWDEVRSMLDLTRFGGHTHDHPILSQIDNLRAEEEIRLCRDRIVAETGIAPRYFAYPNGRPCDFTESNKAALQRHGFDLGFSTSPGLHRPGMDRFSIRRQPTAARSLGDFASLVAGRQG